MSIVGEAVKTAQTPPGTVYPSASPHAAPYTTVDAGHTSSGRSLDASIKLPDARRSSFGEGFGKGIGTGVAGILTGAAILGGVKAFNKRRQNQAINIYGHIKNSRLIRN